MAAEPEYFGSSDPIYRLPVKLINRIHYNSPFVWLVLFGAFNRTIELPAEVDPTNVKATYQKGVLEVKLRKDDDYQTRRIEIKAG